MLPHVTRLRQHGLAAGRLGTGPADGARPGALLRRHGPLQERAQHDDDDLRLARGHLRSCGCSSATRWRSVTTSARGLLGDPPQYAGLGQPKGEDINRARRPAHPVRGLPGAVLRDHRRAGLRRDRRPGPVLRLDGVRRLWTLLVYAPVAHWVFDFSAGDQSAAGWPTARRCRLRRRHRRRDLLRRLGARAGAGARAAGRLRQGADASAQPDPGDARRRAAVVRLVRLQRRLRARRQPDRRGRLHDHAARRRGGSLGWLPLERVRYGHATSLGRLRSGRRPGRDHAVLRLVSPIGAIVDGLRRRGGLCPGRRPQGPLALRRLARRRRRPPRRRPDRHLRDRPHRDVGRADRRGRPVLRRWASTSSASSSSAAEWCWSTRSSCPASSVSSVDKTMGFRIHEEHEVSGIDLAVHAESAYDLHGTWRQLQTSFLDTITRGGHERAMKPSPQSSSRTSGRTSAPPSSPSGSPA